MLSFDPTEWSQWKGVSQVSQPVLDFTIGGYVLGDGVDSPRPLPAGARVLTTQSNITRGSQFFDPAGNPLTPTAVQFYPFSSAQLGLWLPLTEVVAAGGFGLWSRIDVQTATDAAGTPNFNRSLSRNPSLNQIRSLSRSRASSRPRASSSRQVCSRRRPRRCRTSHARPSCPPPVPPIWGCRWSVRRCLGSRPQRCCGGAGAGDASGYRAGFVGEFADESCTMIFVVARFGPCGCVLRRRQLAGWQP